MAATEAAEAATDTLREDPAAAVDMAAVPTIVASRLMEGVLQEQASMGHHHMALQATDNSLREATAAPPTLPNLRGKSEDTTESMMAVSLSTN